MFKKTSEIFQAGAESGSVVVVVVVETTAKEPEQSGRGGGQVAGRAGGFQGGVFVQADLVEGVPPSVDGKPYDLVFLRSADACFK